jgi:hypothetical protein
MLIQINITIPPGGSAGPFDLYSDADGYTNPFQTQVPALTLTNGYVIELPTGATIIRVCSVGTCDNCIDLPTNCPTTTTTSSSSTSTTTSTSTSTSTTTTDQPPNRFNWELITNTPSSLIAADPQSSNLKIDVNGTNVVDATITGNASSQSGTIQILPGDVVSATIDSNRVGVYNFINTIQKDGILYQGQDVCTFCTDSFVSALSPNYTGAGVDVDFSFIADTYKEVTTTTTSSTSSTSTTTSTSSSSTTTTTTTCDCSLNNPTVTLTGTTTTKTPITTTTSTTPSASLAAGIRSITSSSNLNIGLCNADLAAFLWKNGSLAEPQINDFTYDVIFPALQTFNGDNKWYKFQLSISTADPGTWLIKIDTNGRITNIEDCPDP